MLMLLQLFLRNNFHMEMQIHLLQNNPMVIKPNTNTSKTKLNAQAPTYQPNINSQSYHRNLLAVPKKINDNIYS